MRFNNRACALMDIPDLPQGAFEHIGDRKIKPQGGGNPISAITDPISDVLGTSGGGGGILGGAEDLVKGTSSALADVDKFVGREIPGGWVTPALIAAAATTGYLDPSLLGGEAAFTGATETGLATLAGEGALVDTIGATLLSEAATEAALAEVIGQALPYSEAFDAVNLANQGLGAEQIAQNLTVSGLDSFLAEDMARLASQGLSPEQIAQTLSYSYTPAELAGTGIESKALGAASKGLSASQAVQAARLGMGLLGQQQPQRQPQQQMMIGGSQTNPYGSVDYSGLLNLLQPRMASRNSLLG